MEGAVVERVEPMVEVEVAEQVVVVEEGAVVVEEVAVVVEGVVEEVMITVGEGVAAALGPLDPEIELRIRRPGPPLSSR